MAIFEPSLNPHKKFGTFLITSTIPTAVPDLVQIRPWWFLGKWVKYNKIFFIIYLYLFQELTYRTDPSADFHARWLQQHELMQGCTFLGGFIDIAPRFLGWNTPKTPILWAWMDVVTTGSKCSHRKRIPRGTEWQSQWPCMTVVSPASCRTNLLH